MDDTEAIAQLVHDLRWQIDQMPVRGIRDKAGNPYNPSYYKRGLQNAVNDGGGAVPEFVRGYLRRSPSDGYKKLEEKNSLDLACEALVADETKPYAHLFTEDDRVAARKRLAPYLASIEERRSADEQRIEARRKKLPSGLDELRELADGDLDADDQIAVNGAITQLDPNDPVAFLRLGRAHESRGEFDEAIEAFEGALAADPENAIAKRRKDDVERRRRQHGRTPS